MREGKVQMGVTRSPSRDQESLLPAENQENVPPKPFGQPCLYSRHFLEVNLVLKESSCPSWQKPWGGLFPTYTMSVHRVFVFDFLEWDTDLAMAQHA